MLKLNIRNKLLVPTVSLIVVGMSILVTISYVQSKNALTKALHENTKQQVHSATTSFQAWLKDCKLNLRSWSSEDLYSKATRSSIIGKAARVTANSKMERLKIDYGYYDDIFLADQSSNVIASSSKSAIGKIKVGDRPYFHAAKEGREFVSKVSISRQSGNPVIFIAAPVNESKQFQGALVGLVNIGSFSSQVIDPIKIGETGYAFIMDNEGLIVAHPDKSKIMKESLFKHDWAQEMLRKKTGMISYRDEGIEKTAAFEFVPEQEWIIAITVPDEEILTPIRNLRRITIFVAALVILVVIIVIYVIMLSVTKPINRVVEGLKDAAEGDGDLTKRIEINGEDEVADLAHWFNTFIEKIQKIITKVAENAAELSSSAVGLSEISGQLTENTSETSSKTATVSTSTKDMSSTIASVAGIINEANHNLSIIASGAEEMTSTIDEIAGNTEMGRNIAVEAVGKTTDATSQIGELGNAAMQIGKVVETITEISARVNLLALNATIEAARAGAAGKGFAVVANEIKELANQTEKATNEITGQIQGIQNSTQGAIINIKDIASVVNQVNELVSTIAVAIEEQSVTTREIAGNVTGAAKGFEVINDEITVGARAAESIASDISDVTRATDKMNTASGRVNDSSIELSNLAEQLNEMVHQFKV